MDQNNAVAVRDLVAEYKALDPDGSFFTENGIEWNDALQEPVATEFICKLPFPRLLGEQPDVPEINPDYVPLPDHVECLRASVFTGYNTLLSGPPGSGKSSVIEQLAARLNRPFYVADINEEFRPELFYGERRPDGREINWQDGPMTKALKNKGAFFLMDEVNFASPGVLAETHRVLAGFSAVIKDKACEVVERQPGVLLFAAGNAINNTDEAQMHAGIQTMNRAFLDRFAIVIRSHYPTPQEEEHIILKTIERRYAKEYTLLVKQGLRQVITKIVKVANKLRMQISDGSLPISFSVRKTIAWSHLYCYFRNITKATQVGILSLEESDDAMNIDTIVKSQFGDEYTLQFKETKPVT